MNDEKTKSKIIPSRRKTGTFTNLLYPDQPRASEPASGDLLPFETLPLSAANSTDQRNQPTSPDYSGLIRRKPRQRSSS